MSKVNVALCQMLVEEDKAKNLEKARNMVEEGAKKGAHIVMLPEMFNCPYDINCFRSYAEDTYTGDTEEMLSELAWKNGIYIIGGSIPEVDDEGNLFNTSLVFDPAGEVVAKHRKIHLFDIQVKNGITFQESSVLKSGDSLTIVETPWGKIGVVICYDIRFPELIRVMALAGVKILFVPAAFNMTTGPAHWETLFKSRALDNEIFVLGNSPARNEKASYTAYGHSLAVDPWGQIMAQMGKEEGIINVELDLTQIEETREAIPVWKHRREDIYLLKETMKK